MTPNSLNADLSKVFKDCFEFRGKYHHYSSHTHAPNPGLSIKGIGLIGLPLRERDAKAIISKKGPPASSASITAKGPVVLDATSVSLSNAQWKPFVEGLLTKTVEILGVVPDPRHKPRLELLRVTLHQPGTSTPGSLDTPKNPAAFATLTIVLPSQCSGGGVQITTGKDHPPTVYDTSKNSAATTSILAWYNSIATAVQPVTSGYRLTLTYCILHTSPNTSKPMIPNSKTIDLAFRTALQKWKDNKYGTTQRPKIPLMAYVLNEYPADVRKGITGLSNPRNAMIAKLLLPIAKSLGFSVCLAQLNKKVVGLPDEDHFTYQFIPQSEFKMTRYSLLPRYERDDLEELYHEGDYDTPEMGEIESEDYSLSELTSIDGRKVSTKLGSFNIEGGNVIPSDAFQDDDHEEGEFDRDTGEITLEYECSALVIYRVEDEMDLFLTTKGPCWVLKVLGIGKEPSPTAVKVVNAVLEQLEARGPSTLPTYSMGFPSFLQPREETGAAPKILTIAIAWKQTALWNRAIPFCQQISLQDLTTAVSNGVKAFTIEPIKNGLTSVIKNTKEFHRRVKIIEGITAADTQGLSAHRMWLSGIVREALHSCTKPTPDDVSTVLTLAKTEGLEYITPFIERIEKAETYVVFMALARGLHAQRELPTTSAADKSTLDSLVKYCVTAAIPQWEQKLYVNCYHNGPMVINDKTARICDVVTFCFSIGDLQPCVDLLNGLFHLKPTMNISSRTREIHGPLVSHLKLTLTKLGKPLDSEPFASFYRSTISLYLSRCLPVKPNLPVLPSTAIGCGCIDCTQLNSFIHGTEDMTVFKATQHRRTHVESQIRNERAHLGTYLTTETQKYGSPHSLVVRKCPEVLEAAKWSTTKRAAEAFVKFVCADESTLRKLMGVRHNDVMDALQGTKAFVSGDLFIAYDSSAVTENQEPSKNLPRPPTDEMITKSRKADTPTIGIKRKRQESL